MAVVPSGPIANRGYRHHMNLKHLLSCFVALARSRQAEDRGHRLKYEVTTQQNVASSVPEQEHDSYWQNRGVAGHQS